MSEETKDKRPLENEPSKEKKPEAGEKKQKNKRRRRNYDEYDAEVAQEEKTAETAHGKSKQDEEEESDLDDAKLDAMVDQEEAEDDLAEIDTSNIITGGRRTRGKVIDYKKTAAEMEQQKIPADENDEDDVDDDFKE